MSTTRTALVAGATGLVGRQVVDRLLGSRQYAQVTTLGRRTVGRSHHRLRELVMELDNLRDLAEPLGVDDVFCCLGTTMRKAGSRAAFRLVDLEYPVQLATRCLEEGAQQFLIVSSLGASRMSRSFYLRVKGEMEHALRGVGYRTLVVLRPSVLLGARAEWRFGERVAQAVLRAVAPVLRGRWRKYRPIQAARVAACMIGAARRGLTGVHVVESDDIERCADREPRDDHADGEEPSGGELRGAPGV